MFNANLKHAAVTMPNRMCLQGFTFKITEKLTLTSLQLMCGCCSSAGLIDQRGHILVIQLMQVKSLRQCQVQGFQDVSVRYQVQDHVKENYEDNWAV